MTDLCAPARYPVARKDYRCEQCGTKIAKGEKHLVRPWNDGGKMYTYRAHQDCELAANACDAGYVDDTIYVLCEHADKREDGLFLRSHYPDVYERLWGKK